MTWNYRIVLENGNYTLREVYYNSKKHPYTCCVAGSSPFGETPKELRHDLDMMVTGAKKKVLKIEEITSD